MASIALLPSSCELRLVQLIMANVQEPQIFCVGFLACVSQANEKLGKHPNKELMRGEVFRYGREPRCSFKVDYPHIGELHSFPQRCVSVRLTGWYPICVDLEHLEIRASRKINQDGTVNVIVKHLARLPHRTIVKWPGSDETQALDREKPYLLKSGCIIHCSTSDEEHLCT